MKNDNLKNDNFLSDIEKDISGDWKQIQTDLQTQEKREFLKENPEVPNISYKDFYRLIVDIWNKMNETLKTKKTKSRE